MQARLKFDLFAKKFNWFYEFFFCLYFVFFTIHLFPYNYSEDATHPLFKGSCIGGFYEILKRMQIQLFILNIYRK